jgi:hypothetical protein
LTAPLPWRVPMFNILKVNGPNIVTDRGMVTLSPSQYADGGKTKPVSSETWAGMRSCVVHGPEMIAALKLAEIAMTPRVDAGMAESPIRAALAAIRCVLEKLAQDTADAL